MKRILASTLVAGAAIAGFSAPAHASFDDQFVCERIGDVDVLVVISARNDADAYVQFSSGDGTEEGEPTTEPMRQIPSGSGIKYAGMGVIFHAKGNEGFVETELGSGMCSNPAGETDEAAEEAALNIRARSYGGIVRAGPGMEFDRVTSLQEGDPVTLLVNTGEHMNGYDWFMIMLPDGEIGYQWGGLLCSDELHPPGIYGGRNEACPVR
ncbi:MliC family protein [Pontixanthobacter aquaemixtae]|uniref:SH3b domain-containing protein n=1 Tax=Pontixanthobacter aquaemixtae TaxID=1958940 RepID=A0A845A2R3_9SPHN|nr:MliC family protein [Pontixanthobacter aquaemixtae]MXO91909.1 hypothetical protein [Pontixanthobacter aquaemixtae]